MIIPQFGWTFSMSRKKQQRKMNQLVRIMNKNIENDDLWKGRFYCHQVNYSPFHVYEDKSGAQLFVTLEFVDKKTNKTMMAADTVSSWRHINGYTLWNKMNYFITEWCKVWEENPRPNKDNAIDYRRKK